MLNFFGELFFYSNYISYLCPAIQRSERWVSG